MRTLPLFSSVAQMPSGVVGAAAGAAATGAGCGLNRGRSRRRFCRRRIGNSVVIVVGVVGLETLEARRRNLDAGQRVAMARRFDADFLTFDLERNAVAGMGRGGGHEQRGEDRELLHES